MTDIPPIMYTDVELESYIPTGWVLADGDTPGWDPKRKGFRVTVIDGSDLDWELLVKQSAVEEHGRIEALRRAVDTLFRERFKTFL
jgi:hypothetical protein